MQPLLVCFNMYVKVHVFLRAEWLHSSVHGSPGEPPGSGTVPSGEQCQPEYGHRGTVHVWFCCCVFVCLYMYVRLSYVHLSVVVLLCVHALSLPQSCVVVTSVVLTTFISSPPLFPSLPPSRPHSFCVCLYVFLHLSVPHFPFSNPFCLTLSPFLHLLSFPCPLTLPSSSLSLPISSWGTGQSFIDW